MPNPISMPEQAKILNTIQRSLLEGEVIESIRMVYDPELPVNVYDLGLIYDVQVSEQGEVHVVMTLTSPACPVAESLPTEVQMAALQTPGVQAADVELTWDPPFTIDRIPEHIRLQLGLL